MDRASYTKVCGPLGVLIDAVAVPNTVSAAAGQLFFGLPGEVISQELGFKTEIYSLVGTVPLHVDAYFDRGAEGFAAMGLVLLNESGVCLTDGKSVLPLPVGTVFRHDPCSLHGTCLPAGGTTQEGRLVFLSVDFDLSSDPEDHPAEFAQRAISDAMEKLREQGLLPPESDVMRNVP
jgi:hypothetical protein